MEELREEILAQLNNPTAFHIPILGGIPVSQSVVVTWILMVCLMAATLLLTRNLRVRQPGKLQIALETAVGFLNGFVKENIGPHWRSFAPFLGTMAIYIGLSNMCGIFGLIPPTKDVNVTAALSLMSAGLIYGAQFRFRGLIGGLKHFASPIAILLPINLMEVAIRPLALCMRLFGNILGAHLIMELVKHLSPVVFPIPFSLYFDLFDGAIQTFVFVFLTTLFTAEGIEDEN